MSERVTVYRVRFWDIKNDVWQTSLRWMTEDGVKRTRSGEVVPDSGVEIDRAELEAGEEWTVRGFNPVSEQGFRKSLR